VKQCRVYRVRTTGYTVRYNQWGPKPHTRGSTLYSTDMSQIGNTIIIIFVNTYVGGGKRLSIVIHSFIAPHSLVYNTYKYFSNKLFIHFILLHSYTVPAFLQSVGTLANIGVYGSLSGGAFQAQTPLTFFDSNKEAE
jgi:hypothetical protein